MGTTPSFLSVTNGHISDRSGRSLYALTKIPKGSVNPYQFGNLWIPLISSNMPSNPCPNVEVPESPR